mgnify:CR=1 FL=1
MLKKMKLILSYLWGIETMKDAKWLIDGVLRFYLTYEELKPDFLTIDYISTFRFYLTYEELKLVAFLNILICSFIDFILPMRNWNSFEPSTKGSFFLWFYLTYEELKQPSEDAAETMKNRFYLTYEELKHAFIPETASCPKRFYLTYEELKRFWSIELNIV